MQAKEKIVWWCGSRLRWYQQNDCVDRINLGPDSNVASNAECSGALGTQGFGCEAYTL